jgi:hypothetical protein
MKTHVLTVRLTPAEAASFDHAIAQQTAAVGLETDRSAVVRMLIRRYVDAADTADLRHRPQATRRQQTRRKGAR